MFGIPANQLGGFENLWNIREYGLRGVWDKRESTVSTEGAAGHNPTHAGAEKSYWLGPCPSPSPFLWTLAVPQFSRTPALPP